MSSSKGKAKSPVSSSGGLRILWIPGRKKHNRKGVYNPTKKGIPQYHANQQKKIEPWSLGGTMNHTKIINADLHDNLDVGMATASGAMSLATMANSSSKAIVVATMGEASGSCSVEPPSADDAEASCSGEKIELVVLNDLNGDINKRDIPTGNQFDQLELIDECDEKDRNYSNAESSSSLLSSKDNDSRRMDDYMHNSATLAIGEARRRRRRNSYNNSKKNSSENLDSIDHLNDNNDSDEDTAAGDVIDAVKINGARTANEPRLDTFRAQQKKAKKKKNKKKNVPDDEQRNKDDKLVTCLYYSLVCWDCNIS